MIVSTSAVFSSALLVIAGLFQFTPLKHTCLRACRSPLGFLMSDWNDGLWGAWRMGMRHGSYCLGCCWALISLLSSTLTGPDQCGSMVMAKTAPLAKREKGNA
jgi:predicted metal-binding membrane protein